jgi:hypothetical protein
LIRQLRMSIIVNDLTKQAQLKLKRVECSA